MGLKVSLLVAESWAVLVFVVAGCESMAGSEGTAEEAVPAGKAADTGPSAVDTVSPALVELAAAADTEALDAIEAKVVVVHTFSRAVPSIRSLVR